MTFIFSVMTTFLVAHAHVDACAGRLSANAVELITDPGVATGFSLNEAEPGGRTVDVVNPFQAVATRPRWTLQQWGSRRSLSPAATVEEDHATWDDGTKHVTLFRDGVIELGVDGRADWQNIYPQDQPGRAAWPSLTLGFSITCADAHAGLRLDTITRLDFAIDARLTEFVPDRGPRFDANRNKTHVGAFVSIQNLEPTSPDYGRFVWFAIPVFDSTADATDPYCAVDCYQGGLGTHMLIYTPGSAAFGGHSLHGGQWTRIAADLRAHVEDALNAALSRGALVDPDRAHYFVGGFTIGWETQGLDRAAFAFRNLSLIATTR